MNGWQFLKLLSSFCLNRVLFICPDQVIKMDAIRKQVEFYFSDSNFRKDAFLKAATEADAEKFVPISTLLTFNKLKNLTTDADVVAEAMKGSATVIVSEDGKKLKRLVGLPEMDDSNARTIYVKGFPTDDATITIESIEEQFSTYGKVCMVRLRRQRDSKEFKGSCFIEFETEEAANACVKAANEGGTVQLSYKGTPFLCVMQFVDWYKRKQANWENKKSGNANKAAAAAGGDGADSSSKKRKAEDEAAGPVQFTSGLIIHVKNLPADASLMQLKDFFRASADIKFVEYKTGDTEAFVRTGDVENSAKLQAAIDSGLVFTAGDAEDASAATFKLTGAVLAGEEEVAYWNKIESGAKGKAAAGGRGGGRGGRGGRGGGRGGGGRGRGFKKSRN